MTDETTPDGDTHPETPGATPADQPVPDVPGGPLESQAIEVLRTVFDPEIPVNIYELGMIYGIEVIPPGTLKVRMTLTSPMCPVAGSLPGEVQQKLRDLPGVAEAAVELVWDPPWTPDKMTEAARLQLGMM